MSKKPELPYGLALDRVFELLEEIKKRPGSSEEDIAMRFGKTYERAKSIAAEFQLISTADGRPALTEIGKKIAWETDDERKQGLMLSEIVMGYSPYEIALGRMMKEGKDEITTDFVQQIWAGDMGVKLGIGNLSRAVSLMFQVLQYSGLGKYVIGRHGAKTRFAFHPNASERTEELQTRQYRETEGMKNLDDLPKSAQSTSLPGDDEWKVIEVPADHEPRIRKEPSAPSWSRLETDFFSLRIEKSQEAWHLLETMLPIYRRKLGIKTSVGEEGRKETEQE